MRRILGIDPGSRVTGFGVIVSDGLRSEHLASGCIRVTGDEFSHRLGEIFRQVAEVIEEYTPVEVAIEQVFMSKNAASALKLGHARGAAICAAVVAGLPVAEYTPRMIKQSVVGTGSADKMQVRHMVRRLLNLDVDLTTDQSDALAVALSHAHSHTTLQRLSRSVRRRGR